MYLQCLLMCLQCQKCWSGSGKFKGHRGPHCLNTPIRERRKRKNMYQKQRDRFKKKQRMSTSRTKKVCVFLMCVMCVCEHMFNLFCL